VKAGPLSESIKLAVPPHKVKSCLNNVSVDAVISLQGNAKRKH